MSPSKLVETGNTHCETIGGTRSLVLLSWLRHAPSFKPFRLKTEFVATKDPGSLRQARLRTGTGIIQCHGNYPSCSVVDVELLVQISSSSCNWYHPPTVRSRSTQITQVSTALVPHTSLGIALTSPSSLVTVRLGAGTTGTVLSISTPFTPLTPLTLTAS